MLWRLPPPILPTPLFQILSNSPLSLPTPTPIALSVVLFLDWMGDHTMGEHYFVSWYYRSTHLWIHLSTRRTLMCVLCNKASSLLRSSTCDFLLVLWFDITHTQIQTQHTQGPVHWHTHINTYLHHLLFVHSSYLYYTEWKIYFPQCLFFSNIIHL